MIRHATSPAARLRRRRRRVALLLAFVALLALLLPPLSALADVRTATGLRGTVLGRAAWYGTYALDGIGVVLCLDAEKVAPDSEYAYEPAAPVAGVAGARIAYVATAYGGTRDPLTAIAAKLVVHDLQDARYPDGELDVTRLEPRHLSGFDGHEAAIVSRARQVMQDTLARYRAAPYRLSLAAPAALDDDGRATVTATLLDGRGRALPGVPVTFTTTNASPRTTTLATDSRGQARVTVTATDRETPVRVTASATAPSPTPAVYAPTRDGGRAQRVVVGGDTPVTRTTVTTSRDVAPPPDTTVDVTVRKTGAVTAYHPVDGAVFELRAETPDGERVAGPVTIRDGVAVFPRAVTTGLGALWLVETVAPAGYAVADPVAVPLEGTVAERVHNDALPGVLRLAKVDAHTGAPVAGAVLHVRYDSDHDGVFTGPADVDLGRRTTAASPVPLGDLLPGDYEVVEVAAPPGYHLPADNRVVVRVPPGGDVTATLADPSLTTVEFAKRATGTFDPARYSLAGAVFVVRDQAGREAGRCVTGATGRCGLPEQSLVSGERYCWAETVAPPGFAPAAGGCFVAERREAITVVRVAERGRWAVIEAVKHDPAGRRLPGARLALYDGATLLASGTTGAGGVVRFPPVPPGRAYCVRELAAPAGYRAATAPRCTGVLAPDSRVALALVNTPLPPVRRPAPALPHTGGAAAALAVTGFALTAAGATFVTAGRSLRGRPSRG